MAAKSLMKRNSPISASQLHYYHTDFYYSMPDLHKSRKMHGIKRVLVFCIMIVILPATLIIMPLYLRNTVFADVVYPVAESDIIEIRDGISSIFCEKHTLKMNSHFNAFQLQNKPEISTSRKHIRLKKSMTLPDDTLEYWGFFLLKGARVSLKFCSLYNGSRILVVKGKRELKLCGLTDHNKNKLGANYAQGHDQVKVFFEDVLEITEEKLPADGLLEHENHGGEDLTDDHVPFNVTADNATADNATALNATALNATAVNATAVNGNAVNGTALNVTTTTASPAKHFRKKLKKGSLFHQPHVKSAEAIELGDNATETASQPANRHRRHSLSSHELQKRQLYEQLYKRKERKKRENVYDRKYSHGGNAMNFTETDESNSISSFETGLFTCFNGAILLAEGFPPKSACTNRHFLEKGKQDTVLQNITEDGYYYYIFYSDNDLVRNDIHAIFDIYKPTFQYANLSESRSCLNSTDCTFSIGFLSDEIVVVEVPTRDGIEHEEDDITYLISTCHPRSAIYALFPITVLVLILSCSFL